MADRERAVDGRPRRRRFSSVGALAAVLAVAALLTAAGPVVGSAVSAASVTPTLISTASPTVTVGRQIFDNVNLLGGANPSGTVTFRLFGPGDAGCTTPIFSSTVAVIGSSVNSALFTTSAAGIYRGS